ncbi:MAG: FAD-dependent oxidoreductase, partial [Verrucomicrobia bacterium]|nr:FAD-dependent oxidoreductase [Verrucomicrobiota bacterium]
MKPIVRRALTGLLCGAVASPFLCLAFRNASLGLFVGALLGVAQAFAFSGLGAGPALDRAMTCGALGLPCWAVLNVLLLPWAAGQKPPWNAEGLRALVPSLMGWWWFCCCLGALAPAIRWLSARVLGPESRPRAPLPREKITQVLILGGGFAGVTTAARLEKRFRDDPSVSLVLISETNAWLFTPMLAEVAASSLEPTHISTPLRTSLKRTRVLRGRVTAIDLDGQRVELNEQGPDSGLPYDHLVLALGSVSDHLGNSAVAQHAFGFKTLWDAMRLRNHVIDAFERADREPDPARRRSLLTFVVAGGGFSGVELTGALNDFARGMLADYPDLSAEELRIVLVHSRDRVLPELSESLARYAMGRMRERGVTFRLNARVSGAGPGWVTLSTAECI